MQTNDIGAQEVAAFMKGAVLLGVVNWDGTTERQIKSKIWKLLVTKHKLHVKEWLALRYLLDTVSSAPLTCARGGSRILQ